MVSYLSRLEHSELVLRPFENLTNSIPDVTSHIMVLGTCVQRRSKKISTCKVHEYQCMCKMVESVHAAVETQRIIFC